MTVSHADAVSRPTYFYRAFGMTIAVDRPIPRLTAIEEPGDEAPVTIGFGSVPETLKGAEASDELYQANDSAYLFRQPGAWASLVEHGRHALFETLQPTSEELFWYIAVTNSIGVAGYQRGLFPLHGSGVLFPSGMVAFTGQSGAGKTTLTAGLVQRGFPLYADDLCLIAPDGQGGYKTGRGVPEIRLLRDAADALGWDQGDSIGHQARRDKFAFVRDEAPVEEAPMRAVVELAFAEGPPRLERLTGVAPFTTFVASIRLRMGLPAFPRTQRGPAFERVTAMARIIPVYRFTRPRDYAAFNEGTAILMNEFGRS